MAEDSQFAQATQAFSFQDFLERMKEPAAADLVRYIKTYDGWCIIQRLQHPLQVYQDDRGSP